MTRPSVSVVMPFAGSSAEARRATAKLLDLTRREDDELIVADNSGTVPEAAGMTVVPASAERSPAHARNAGAERASGEWILFLDADCTPSPDLLDRFHADSIRPETGALAGEVRARVDAVTLAARYGTARNFLSQEAHLAHPYRPRAAAANLMVRRLAFEQLGGFYEGLRAAEDTDFCWRLQEAGWRLEIRPQAWVEHRYRASVSELRRQWRGYAAGRAWLSRRYSDFTPEPALLRAAKRIRDRSGERGLLPVSHAAASPGAAATIPPADRVRFLALDALLALDELAGFLLSNRPRRDRTGGTGLVFVAEWFPAPGDTPLDVAPGQDPPRVEAIRRPPVVDRRAARALRVDYREDDGIAARASALAALIAHHPGRVARDLLARAPGEPPLSALAPAVHRLAQSSRGHVRALGGGEAGVTARRLSALAGAPLGPGAPPDPGAS